jgi:hypothetical protein
MYLLDQNRQHMYEQYTYAHDIGDYSRGEPVLPSPALLPLVPTLPLAPPTTETSTAGTIVCTYRGHTHRVRRVAWSPDGRHLASAVIRPCTCARRPQGSTSSPIRAILGRCMRWSGRPMGDTSPPRATASSTPTTRRPRTIASSASVSESNLSRFSLASP